MITNLPEFTSGLTELMNAASETQKRIAAIDSVGYALAHEERALEQLHKQIETNRSKRFDVMLALSSPQPTPESVTRITNLQAGLSEVMPRVAQAQPVRRVG